MTDEQIKLLDELLAQIEKNQFSEKILDLSDFFEMDTVYPADRLATYDRLFQEHLLDSEQHLKEVSEALEKLKTEYRLTENEIPKDKDPLHLYDF